MDPHVGLQVALQAEVFATFGAAEQFFGRTLSVGLVSPRLRGLGGTPVGLELREPGEVFPTGAAAEAFLLRVNRHVQLHASLVCKSFVAKWATERFLSSVNSNV